LRLGSISKNKTANVCIYFSKEDQVKAFRIGLYGCGCRTRQVLERALKSGMAKVTLCHDIDCGKAGELAEKYHAEPCTLNKLLSGEEVDMYLISLFPAAHPDALLAAAETGKPVYIEKPVAVFMPDVVRLIPLIGKSYVHVGLSYRYLPVFRELARLVKDGKIGELAGINFNWLCNHFTRNQGAGANPNWRYVPETGGELTQHYCHCFEWFRTLGGDFRSLTAMSLKMQDNQSCLEDLWDLIIKQKSGCQISFHSSERNPRYSVHGYLEGTKGSLEWEWNNPSKIIFYKGAHERREGEPLPVPGTVPDALEEFISRIRRGEPPEVTLEDGLWSVLPPIYARESATTGNVSIFPERLTDLLKGAKE